VRPLRLEVEGFTSFRKRLTVDFSGLDLFAITGPTGVGKSSLIDALVFALYGQVPRVGDDYKQLISHGAERLAVLLEFEAGRERYRIARTVRRAGASKQLLERLDGDEPEPLADRVKEIRIRVERILGLDYDGFTRSVVLPQGQFDEFLKGEPKERRKILVSLLDLGVYETMQKLANQRGSEARKEAGFVAEQLERDFSDATPETLEARKGELATVEGEAAGVEKALAGLAEGLTVAQKLRAARREDQSLAEDEARERARRAVAEKTVAGGEAARTAAEIDVAAVAERIDGLGVDEDRHTALVAARPRAERLCEFRDQVGRADQGRTEALRAVARARATRATVEVAVPAAEGARVKADAAVAAARAKKEDVHRRHAAVVLRRGLKAGETCPVCEQEMPGVPKGRAPGLDSVDKSLGRAETAARDAAAAAEAARLELQKSRTSVDGLERELAQAEDRHGELETARSAVEHDLSEAGFEAEECAEPSRLLKRLQAELRTLEAARQTRADLEARKRALEERRATLQAELAAATAEQEGARARLEEIAGKRVAASALVQVSLEALGTLASREGWEELGTLGDEVEALEERSRESQGRSRKLAARRGALRGDVERIEEKIVRASELRQKKEALDANGALLKTLADHLRANELVAWIQEEALRRLAEDGSHHLVALSQGRYALRLGSGDVIATGSRAEQDFFVVDRWNADGVRSVKTLSGGETFLASLALALALAESLARLSAGGRAVEALDSLFLDEGFGSLDGETLDTVVAALDELHGGQRLVGIVTHVRDLAERMPARLEVRREGATAVAAVV